MEIPEHSVEKEIEVIAFAKDEEMLKEIPVRKKLHLQCFL